MKFVSLVAGAAIASACLTSAASAGVIYSNGVLDGNTNGVGISFEQAIGNSFTLASDATVTGVKFGVWSDAGATISTIAWGITGDPNAVPVNGTAAVTSGAVTDTSGDGYDIRTDTFATGGLFLAAGTYYLWLQDASPEEGRGFFWDINNGPSASFYSIGGGPVTSLANYFQDGTNSEFFQLLDGRAGGAPEPASWAMMLVGFGGLGAAMRARRKASALIA